MMNLNLDLLYSDDLRIYTSEKKVCEIYIYIYIYISNNIYQNG